MKKYFKALIPFSSGTGIYNPSDKEPGKADAALVDSWVNVGYAVEVEAPIEELKQSENKDPENKEPEKEAENEPNEPVNNEVIQNVVDDEKEPENGKSESQNNKFEAMTYPQLKKAAKAANIKNYQSMKQADLIKALKGE